MGQKQSEVLNNEIKSLNNESINLIKLFNILL